MVMFFTVFFHSRMSLGAQTNEEMKITHSEESEFLNLDPCLKIFAISSGLDHSKYCMDLIFLALMKHFCHHFADMRTSHMRFTDADELLNIRNHPQFSKVLSALPCVMTIAEANTDEEAKQLIHMVNGFSADKKHLKLISSGLNASYFQNITVHFNVVVEQRRKDGHELTSLCPVLGKRYVQAFKVKCPKHVNQLHGKSLNISFFGQEPFITQSKQSINYNAIGGSDFLIMELMANKFQFTATYIPEESYYEISSHGQSSGLAYRVRIFIFSMFTQSQQSLLGFYKTERGRNWSSSIWLFS